MGWLDSGIGIGIVNSISEINDIYINNIQGGDDASGISFLFSKGNVNNVIIQKVWSGARMFGFSCAESEVLLSNAVISDIFEIPEVPWGTGIRIHGSKSILTIVNLIINKSGYGIYNEYNGSCSISYSDIFTRYEEKFINLDSGLGLLNQTNTNGDSCDAFFNISKDPQFISDTDLHLKDSSPCINAGTPDGAPLFDLDGNPRDALPDMGAYEYISPVAVEQTSREFALLPNYPNPFNAATTISFALPKSGSVTLAIYNINGQRVRNLSGVFDAGTHAVNWNGCDDAGRPMSSGLYFSRLETNGIVKTGKMVLMR
jgi:hypothetical protein